MLKERNNKFTLFVSWTLTVICMAVIFWLSSKTADESSQQSNIILEWLASLFGDNLFSTFIVRKSAHFLEYTGLSFLFNISLYCTKRRPLYLYAVLFTSLYAVTDEIHQLFVEGRACKITDWAIDTAGAILGALIFAAITVIIASVKKKKKSNGEQKI